MSLSAHTSYRIHKQTLQGMFMPDLFKNSGLKLFSFALLGMEDRVSSMLSQYLLLEAPILALSKRRKSSHLDRRNGKPLGISGFPSLLRGREGQRNRSNPGQGSG